MCIMCAQIVARWRTGVRACVQTYVPVYRRVRAEEIPEGSWSWAYTHINTHAYTHVFTHLHTHAYTRVCAHAYAHA